MSQDHGPDPSRDASSSDAATPSPLSAAQHNDRRLFDSLNEGVWERDLSTGEAWYSPRYKALLGFDDHELPNRMDSIRERVHPEDAPLVQAAFEQATRTIGTGRCEARIMVRDGGWRWFRGRFRVWPDAQGRASILVGALHDIHDQVVATEALRAQQAVLEQRVLERTRGLEDALQQAEAQRLAAEQANQAKASFLAHMSHELRTPLNGVLGMNQLAQALARGPEQRRYLELAQQSGQALLSILDDVLDFARAEAGRLQLRVENFDLANLASETLRSFMPDAHRKGLQVGFDYIGSVTQVRADAGRVRQIISNLVGNAIKFTDAGSIVLTVDVTGALAASDDKASTQPCRAQLRVRDTGTGMDEETAVRVFMPFEQGESGSARRHGGTGLGLSVVRMLAQLMGGDVTVQTRPEQGCEFCVDLMLEAPVAQPLPAVAASTPPGGNVWLLLRNPAQGRRLQQRFARLGWSCDALVDVHSAIERLRTGSAPPGSMVIVEDALSPRPDFASLRRALPAGVPITLLLRPDFDLGAVHSVTDQWQVRISIAPCTPTELHAMLQPTSDTKAAVAAPAQADVIATGFKPSVLVVEDNPMNQIIAREMVAALGLLPAVVGSGEEAMLSCQSTPPDLVLMDIQMPGMDGLETTRRLRALQDAGSLRRFPIIALTAHAMPSDRQASISAGMDEHLTKPVQLEQLRTVLQRWLGRRDG
jgi:PAS domain S-box-containing protein